VVSFPALLPSQPWPEGDKLRREKSVLGFYVSGHPLLRHEQEVNDFATVHLGDMAGFTSGAAVRACGIVTSVKKKVDKRNNTMAFIGLEDFTGRAECIVFADPYARFQQLLQPDALVMVIGKGELNGDSLKILVNDVMPLERVRERFAKRVIFSINLQETQEQTIVSLRELMERNRGACPCYVNVTGTSGPRVFQTRRFAVEPSEQFLEEARRMLGPRGIRFTT
jgi:DNA polymerase-3 subunit alpha